MNKKCFLWALLFVFLAASTVFAKDYALRKVCWVMTKAQVKAAEKDKLIKEDKLSLYYATKIKKYPFTLIYCFDKGYLDGAVLQLKQKPSKKIFLDLKKILELKYKKATEQHNNSEFTCAIWYTKTTQITLGFTKKKTKFLNCEPGIHILYCNISSTNGTTQENKKAAEKL